MHGETLKPQYKLKQPQYKLK